MAPHELQLVSTDRPVTRQGDFKRARLFGPRAGLDDSTLGQFGRTQFDLSQARARFADLRSRCFENPKRQGWAPRARDLRPCRAMFSITSLANVVGCTFDICTLHLLREAGKARSKVVQRFRCCIPCGDTNRLRWCVGRRRIQRAADLRQKQQPRSFITRSPRPEQARRHLGDGAARARR